MNLFKQILRFVKMTQRAGGMRGLVQDGPKYLQLFRRLLADGRVPLAAKAVLIGGIAFALSPLNLPQYIPVVGALDDIGIVLFVGSLFFKMVPASVVAEHRQAVGLRDMPAL